MIYATPNDPVPINAIPKRGPFTLHGSIVYAWYGDGHALKHNMWAPFLNVLNIGRRYLFTGNAQTGRHGIILNLKSLLPKKRRSANTNVQKSMFMYTRMSVRLGACVSMLYWVCSNDIIYDLFAPQIHSVPGIVRLFRCNICSVPYNNDGRAAYKSAVAPDWMRCANWRNLRDAESTSRFDVCICITGTMICINTQNKVLWCGFYHTPFMGDGVWCVLFPVIPEESSPEIQSDYR